MVCCSGTQDHCGGSVSPPGASSLSQAILPLCTPSFIYDPLPLPPPPLLKLLLELHSAVPPSQPSSTCHLAVGRIYEAELLDLSPSPLTTPCLALCALGWSAHSSYKRLTHAARLDGSLSLSLSLSAPPTPPRHPSLSLVFCCCGQEAGFVSVLSVFVLLVSAFAAFSFWPSNLPPALPGKCSSLDGSAYPTTLNYAPPVCYPLSRSTCPPPSSLVFSVSAGQT